MSEKKTKEKGRSRLPKDIDFEIHFYETILKATPYFIEALAALGDLYTKKGLYEKGLEIDLRLIRLRHDDPSILYNLACSYSLVNNIEAALNTIRSAVQYGYNDWEYLARDPDLTNLRRDQRFEDFITQLRHKRVTQL